MAESSASPIGAATFRGRAWHAKERAARAFPAEVMLGLAKAMVEDSVSNEPGRVFILPSMAVTISGLSYYDAATSTQVGDCEAGRMIRELDFLVIGAQKAATTTLFELLREHPDLWLPPQKEIPFFLEKREFMGDYAKFVDAYFYDAHAGQRIGKVTPQYMADPMSPKLIRDLLPEVRLVAILRDPVERLRSHYKMAKRRGMETRLLEEALADQLEEHSLIRARAIAPAEETENECYIAWSEYGRILSRYVELFPRDQILIVYTEALAENPRSVMRQVYAHLGVSPDFIPHGLGVRRHEGGTSYRSQTLRKLLKSKWVHRAGRLMPRSLKGRVSIAALEFWNANGRTDMVELPSEIRGRLLEHFREDLCLLPKLMETSNPWGARYR